MFCTNCVDTGDALLHAIRSRSPRDSYLPGCPTVTPPLDIGRLYGVNILVPYTHASGDGVDMLWNFSTWNPYRVMLARTHLRPAQ